MTAGSDGIFVAAPIWRSFIDAAGFNAPETNFVAYTPSGSLSSLPVRPPGIALAPIEGRTLYIDRKTGREIPRNEAEKMKKKRYQIIRSDPFLPETP